MSVGNIKLVVSDKHMWREAQLAAAQMSCKETTLNRAQEGAVPLVECAFKPSGGRTPIDLYATHHLQSYREHVEKALAFCIVATT